MDFYIVLSLVSTLTGSVHLYHFFEPKVLKNKVKIFDSYHEASSRLVTYRKTHFVRCALARNRT